MDRIDLTDLRRWIGRRTEDEDLIDPRHARLMAATIGLDQNALCTGSPLPPLWHWLYFLNALPASQLGPDSHPIRGEFLPPVPLSNRLWAGGEVRFEGQLPLGASATKHSRVHAVEHKQGQDGDLVFVTVRHEVRHAQCMVVTESHDIVFKDPGPPRAHRTSARMPHPTHTEQFKPDATTLFRYSALTFNGHRIHYDADYCRQVEGYPQLVIHGPLIATLLAAMAQRVVARPLASFRYRARQPSFLGDTLTLNAVPHYQDLTLWASLPNGAVSMQAQASFTKPMAPISDIIDTVTPN